MEPDQDPRFQFLTLKQQQRKILQHALSYIFSLLYLQVQSDSHCVQYYFNLIKWYSSLKQTYIKM